MKKINLLLLVLAMLMTACAGNTAEDSTGIMGGESTNTAPGAMDENIVLYDEIVLPVNMFNYGVTSSDGYYEDFIIGQDVYTFYIDYESMQRVFLCSAPNCTHDDESCTALNRGRSFLSADYSKLFFYKYPTETTQDIIEMSDLSGTDSKELYSSDKGGIKVVAVGTGHVYAIEDSTLGAIVIENGEFKPLMTIDESTMFKFRVKAEGGSLYLIYSKTEPRDISPENIDAMFSTPDTREFTIERLSLATGERTVLYTEVMDSNTIDEGEIYNGSYYIYPDHNSDSSLKKIDLETGEKTVVGTFSNEIMGYLNNMIINLTKGYFSSIIYDEENNGRFYHFMDLETGEVFENRFTYVSNEIESGFNKEMRILCDLGDSLLIKNGEWQTVFEYYHLYSEEYEYPTATLNHVAVISKEDYFAGNINNIRPIDSSSIVEVFEQKQ